MKNRILALFGMLVFLAACQTTSVSELKTGAFNNDFNQTFDAYWTLKGMSTVKIERKMVEKMGFNFKLKNIEYVPGIEAFRRIFGDASLQHVLTDPSKFGDVFREMNQYYVYLFPFHGINTVDDRFYFSRKNTIKEGDDLMIIFVFKHENDGDYLLFLDHKYLKVNSKESTSGFASGLIEVIGKYAGAASGAKELVDKLKELFVKQTTPTTININVPTQ